ncbi:hypothetical protein WR25_22891 [Diploscapter pachys]|uniref:Phosphatidylcholine transfer protein n=1 Tax=Diploscapter pachys TaxID=2018661 RepID=A0A2A2KTV5_9BILA|nr:hypothetical protein WR25_22891 [Diploscapter pachys]
MVIQIKKTLRRIIHDVDRSAGLVLTDRDGVVIASIGDQVRTHQGWITGHFSVIEKTQKINLGAHSASIFQFDNNQLVVLSVQPFTCYLFATPKGFKQFLECNSNDDFLRSKKSRMNSAAIWAKFRQIFTFRLAQNSICRQKNWRFEFYQRYTRRLLSFLPSRICLFDRRILLAATSAAGFSFKDYGISDERMHEARESDKDFDHVDDLPKKGWEKIYEEKYLHVFRRRVKGPYEMYEYKCIGSYFDISPRTFLDVQNDLTYRKVWDGNVISLELLKEEDENELIRWVAKYPYPMYPREYIYARRTWVSDDDKVVVVDSEVVQPNAYPSTSNNVRVCTYTSRMAVRAHKNWNDHGLDYMLTYSDNPEANIPRYVYNYIINQGGPYFLKQVHSAARNLEKSGHELKSTIEHAKNAIRNRKQMLKNQKVEPKKVEEPKIVVEEKENVQHPKEKEEKRKDEAPPEKKHKVAATGTEYADGNGNGSCAKKDSDKKKKDSRFPVHADSQINATLT